MFQVQVQDVRLVQRSACFATRLVVLRKHTGFQNALTYFPERIPWPPCSEEEIIAKWELGVLCSQHVTPPQEQRSLGHWYFLHRTAPKTARPLRGRATGNPAKIWLSNQLRGELIHYDSHCPH